MFHSLLGIFFGTPDEIWTVEIVWTSLAFAGLMFGLFNLRESIKDYKAVPPDGLLADAQKLIARYTTIGEILGMCTQAIFLALGIWVLLYSQKIGSYPGEPIHALILSYLFRWGLTTSSLLLVLNTFNRMRVRLLLRQKVK